MSERDLTELPDDCGEAPVGDLMGIQWSDHSARSACITSTRAALAAGHVEATTAAAMLQKLDASEVARLRSFAPSSE